MPRRFDLRRLPVAVLFLGSVIGLLFYLLRGYFWLIRYDLPSFLLRALLLLPVALFFAALLTLILWYVLKILLPGLLRYRRLRMIRYQRSLRPRHHDEDPDLSR